MRCGRATGGFGKGSWRRVSDQLGHTGGAASERKRTRRLFLFIMEKRGAQNALSSRSVPWCSGLAYVPVKDEIAGSNPVGTAD